MPTIRHNSYKVDTISLVILDTLDAASGPVETPKIVERFPSDEEHEYAVTRGSSIRYRMDRHLIPAGLVGEGECVRKVGGTNSARTFELTDAGRQLITEECAVELDAALREVLNRERIEVRRDMLTDLHETQAVVDALQESVGAIEAEVGRHRDRLDNAANSRRSLAANKADVSALQVRFETVNARLDEIESRTAVLASKLGEVPSDGKNGWISVEEQLSDVRLKAAEQEQLIGKHQRRINMLKMGIEALSEHVEDLEEEVEEGRKWSRFFL